MGKVLVLYDSATGHTRKMAEEVARGARGVPGTEVRLRSVDEASAEDVFWCDGLAVGTPTNLGVMSWKMKRFWYGNKGRALILSALMAQGVALGHPLTLSLHPFKPVSEIPSMNVRWAKKNRMIMGAAARVLTAIRYG